MFDQFKRANELVNKYPGLEIKIPKTLVITTDAFDSFIASNKVNPLGLPEDDLLICKIFKNYKLPEWLKRKLSFYLSKTDKPLCVRSSSMMEDVHFRPYAGLYKTYMVPNNHPDFSVRLKQLLTAVKMVYASTFFVGPRAFSKKTGQSSFDSMAVIIQQMAGREYGDYFYPALSGVGQSCNFYPIGKMEADQGVCFLAMGIGRTVVEGEKCLRFSPEYPKFLPQFSMVDDILDNSQREFYCLRIRGYQDDLHFSKFSNLEKRTLEDGEDDPPVKLMTSTYIPEEHRIRDGYGMKGSKILTFARVLKYKTLPLPELLSELLKFCYAGMGCPVEIEFSVDLDDDGETGTFYLLQVRPMAGGSFSLREDIKENEISKALCYSNNALGNGISTIKNIIYVRSDDFKSEKTKEIAMEVGRFNRQLQKDNKDYLLIGPGRWGSADPWLGIPVNWQDISGIGAIVELRNEQLRVEPSQGSHFFHNLTSLGIPYFTITEGSEDSINWDKIRSLPVKDKSKYLNHVELDKPLIIKINGQHSRGVII
jgi:hypothetical protein